MNHGQPPRTDCAGRPCPPWCDSTHETRAITTHIGEQRVVRYGGEMFADGHTRIAAAATQSSTPARAPEPPAVMLHATVNRGPKALTHVAVPEAASLAAVIEMLGEATPEQHRALAAAIREVAAEITGPEPEAES